MARRKTNDEFLKEVLEITGGEYSVLSAYKNAKTKVQVRHNHDDCGNHVFYVSPNDFLSSGTRCNSGKHRVIQPSQKTTEDFKKEVLERVGDEYVVVGEYVTAHTKVDILHNACGYLWSTSPRNFLNGNRCGQCNKPPFSFEKFCADVKDMYGEEYTAIKHIGGGKVRMIHNVCKKTYETTSSLFRKGVRCGNCHGGIKISNEQFLRRLNKRYGGEFIPAESYRNAITKIRFIHTACSREFVATPNAILSGNGCSLCYQSKGEKRVMKALENFGLKYIAQYTNDMCRYKHVLPFDFAVVGESDEDILLMIEYDGEHHFEAGHFSNSKEDLDFIIMKDELKNDFCYSNNIPILRIPYWEYGNVEHILFDKLVYLDILEEVAFFE